MDVKNIFICYEQWIDFKVIELILRPEKIQVYGIWILRNFTGKNKDTYHISYMFERNSQPWCLSEKNKHRFPSIFDIVRYYLYLCMLVQRSFLIPMLKIKKHWIYNDDESNNRIVKVTFNAFWCHLQIIEYYT